MPRSPTLSQTVENLASINRKLFGKELEYHHFFYITLFLYPIITVFVLLYIKPTFIFRKGSYPLDDHTYNRVCYRRLITWFIIFQLPMVFYFLINTRKWKIAKDKKGDRKNDWFHSDSIVYIFCFIKIGDCRVNNGKVKDNK